MEIKSKEIKLIPIEKLTPDPKNENQHSEKQIEVLSRIIKANGFRDPLTVSNRSGYIIAGNGRFESAKLLGMEELPVIYQDFENEAEETRHRLASNEIARHSTLDQERMLDNLKELDFDLESFDFSDIGLIDFELPDCDTTYPENESKNSLAAQWGVPPFTVLDTRQGYWLERKKAWLELTGNLTATKENVLSSTKGVYGVDTKDVMAKMESSSNFDPVLAEIAMKWFNTEKGSIIDPFGGEQTKGVVAGHLGYKYTAVEFRDAQCEFNKSKTSQYEKVSYFCGDSNNISKIIKERDFDLCFTSPPYYDLEVYSKDDMSALGTYEEFMNQYKNIFSQCYEMLANNRFLVIKIGEIRNKKTGEYRNFIGDNISIMKEIGFKYYNELVLINSAGTAPLRANRFMGNRKMVKLHQNILVFFKGELNSIKSEFKHEVKIIEFQQQED